MIINRTYRTSFTMHNENAGTFHLKSFFPLYVLAPIRFLPGEKKLAFLRLSHDISSSFRSLSFFLSLPRGSELACVRREKERENSEEEPLGVGLVFSLFLHAFLGRLTQMKEEEKRRFEEDTRAAAAAAAAAFGSLLAPGYGATTEVHSLQAPAGGRKERV